MVSLTGDPCRVEPLATARTQIRPLGESDLRPLMSLYGDERVTRFLPYATWRSMADAQAWWRQVLRIPAQLYVIVDRQSARVVGICFLYGYQSVSGAAKLGYALAHSHWSKGYMREALAAIASGVFMRTGLARLEADVDPLNTRSVNVVRSLGFGRVVHHAPASGAQRYFLFRHEWMLAQGRAVAGA